MPTDTLRGRKSNPQPGSYQYFAQEWIVFMRLCEDEGLPAADVDAALKGLVHLSTYSDEAPPESPNTLDNLMRAAFYRYERTHLWRALCAPIARSESDG